jgi:lipopolysaccharide export system permease protein
MKILERYVLKEHISPFFMGFGVVTFILTLDMLYDYMDLLIGKGVAPAKVLQLFLLGLGWMIALSVPCGVLVAALMAFGRLSQDNEISAMRASGVNLLRMLLPPTGAAAVVAVLLALFNNYVLPESNHAFATLLYEITQQKPTVQLKAGMFIDDFEGYTIYIGRLDDRSGKMEHVMIYDRTRAGAPPTTIVARTGWASFSKDRTTLTLELHDGEIHEIPDPRSPGKYRKTVFKTHVIHIDAGKSFGKSDRLHRGQREMSGQVLLQEAEALRTQKERVEESLYQDLSSQGFETIEGFHSATEPSEGYSVRRNMPKLLSPLWVAFGIWRPHLGPPAIGTLRTDVATHDAREVQSLLLERKTLQKRVNSYLVEFHKKFSVPFACIVFVLVGGPLGMRARKSGTAIGFASILFFIFYYLCLLGGETLSDRGLLPPWLAMWAPNIVLGIVGLVLVVRTCQLESPPPPAAAGETSGRQA